MLQGAHSALRLRLVSSSDPTPTFYLISRMSPVNIETNLGVPVLNQKHLRAALASLLAWACLAGAREDRVLCKGLDGHMEVERAVNEACADHRHALGPPGMGLLPANRCGPCLDVPLGAVQ